MKDSNKPPIRKWSWTCFGYKVICPQCSNRIHQLTTVISPEKKNGHTVGFNFDDTYICDCGYTSIKNHANLDSMDEEMNRDRLIVRSAGTIVIILLLGMVFNIW